jgi:nicotinate phosphoribosyltransferase
MNYTTSMYNDSRAIMSSYLHWRIDKSKVSNLELYCPKMPFGGNVKNLFIKFAFIAGIDEIVEFLIGFKFSDNDVSWLRDQFDLDDEYLKELTELKLSDVKIYALNNGDIFYKEQPMVILTGPLYKIKLLEFPIVNILGFSYLICTNALRMRLLAGKKMRMLEFGLRRAQGPLAGLTASKYAYLGNFDGI